MKPLVVFDCMVYLQGAARRFGPARACFRLVDEERMTLFVTPEILAEVRDVLTRPKTQRKFPLLSPECVEAFVQDIQHKAVVLPHVPRVFSLERDPKDEPYLNLALAARAGYLVSRDRDLLDLMHDEAFRQQFPGLLILDPAAFLQAIASRGEPQHASAKKQSRRRKDRARPNPTRPPEGDTSGRRNGGQRCEAF